MKGNDGTWLLSKNYRTKYHKIGEAVEILRDVCPTANIVARRTVEKFNQNLWNKDKV